MAVPLHPDIITKSKMKKIMAVTVAAAMLMAGCTQEKKAEMMHSVMTVQPQQMGGTQLKQFSGQVKESADVNLGFKTAGQILKIYVKEGQRVSKGQLLAQLDDKDYNLGVKAAQAQYNQLKNEVARLKKLYDAKSITANDYEKATSGLEQVSVNLENNKNKVAYTKLYAPANGIIQSVNFEVMEMVNAGTPVFNILYTGGMEVEVNIPTNIYLQRSNFKATYCSLNGHSYQARLLSIVPKADNTQLYKATFAIEGATDDVVSGMNANVSIDINGEGRQVGMTVPAKAVFENNGKSYVWVVAKDSTVNRQEVSLGGAAENGHVLITSGLKGDETIVKAGVNALQDKERVKIISKASETNVGEML